MIGKTIIFCKNSFIHIEYMDDYAILISEYDGCVTCLNKVGLQVFELIDGVKTIGEIASILALKFHVDSEIVFEDVSSFCKELFNYGHIV